jgi:hypothetical protein
MSADISHILRDWSFDPDHQYRVVDADDGRQVLQVRQPLGVEQYELDGRPDGAHPFGRDWVLEEFQERVRVHEEVQGAAKGFSISHDEFVLLQNEAILVYYRYFILFQIGDYERTSNDTSHNLQICGLVDRFAEKNDDKKDILQYRPYVLRMNATSRAMILLGDGDGDQACAVLENAIEKVQTAKEVDTPTYHFERVRSLQYLRTALREVKAKRVKAPVERLRRELDEAVRNEEYERAAELRDRIRNLSASEH